MKFAPQILSAVAVVAIAGAVSGATIGDSPVLKEGHGDTLPEAPIINASNDALRHTTRPPDHYPLKTPEGTIEVAELALHGRLHDRGGNMWWDDRSDQSVDMNAGYDFYETASPERIAREEALLAYTGGRADGHSRPVEEIHDPVLQRVTRAEAPMVLAEPAELEVAESSDRTAAEPRIGNSKTVNVAAALARRN
ncbi:hypothetical protein GRI69_13805 [Erythrobacter vulgaris]|uniref:Uncharacterized protein n=1 Tax=Qipengyuania vulgaris TaxID=291985 RepID=A0A844XVD4_9SPHN|nr:hypothetical protein [Qipengyuania vulgaris]MXO49329.1 hypothetical protein [Qipengyuania vulgaris]